MRGRLAILLTIALMIVLLIALNAASYVRVEREALSEFDPDRSTFNADATGARAFYEYLQQSGFEVSRWGKPLTALSGNPAAPANYVIIGQTRLDVESDSASALLSWVRQGGRLVIIDRVPQAILTPASERWRVSSEISEYPGPQVRSDDVETMTRGVPALAPSQPTYLTRDVDRVTRSRFAGRLHVTADAPPSESIDGSGSAPITAPTVESPIDEDSQNETPPPPKPTPTPEFSGPATSAVEPSAEELEEESAEEYVSPAPVVHLADGREGQGALLLDYAYGRGRIVILSDPFIVSNGGIKLSDNLQLATNVVAGTGGSIAFDEYHQGHGATENPVFAYFAGTPVLWIFGQAGVLVLAVLWTRGRRFARALPAPYVDRSSKLEFVASMAELQERARAFDLAIENVYGRTRRALARYAGLQSTAPRKQLAERVAARSGRDARTIEALLRQCEDAISGEPISGRKAVSLTRQLRELERDLGILMRTREIRQTKS
jgi:hypothetical protein